MIGAYAIVTNDKGETDVEIMSMSQIKKSWAKSSSSQQLVHKEFPDQMAKRTVIKRAAKMLINSALSENTIPDDELEPNNDLDPTKQIAPDYAEYEEVEEATPAEAAPVQKEEAKKKKQLNSQLRNQSLFSMDDDEIDISYEEMSPDSYDCGEIW